MIPQCTKVAINWMKRDHMPDVLRIEWESFEHIWTKEDFLGVLRQRNGIGMVAQTNDNRIAGFMIYELHKMRLHILNLAVDPAYRHQGVGTQMAGKLIDKLSQQRREEITLETRESNLSSQLFWKAMGFRADMVLHGFYADSDEDAYVFRFRLNEPAGALLQPHERIGIW